MCNSPSLALEWENGYRKEIPMNDQASISLSGNDLVIEDFDLGDINDLKTAVGYPTYTPCDLVTGIDGFIEGHMACSQQVIVWDCAGSPPPKLKYV